MTAVAVAGGTLAVDDRGTGPAVLLVHGTVLADGMRPLGDELCRAGGRRIVRPHRRGYGAGTAPARASIGVEAEDHRVVLDTLGIDRVDLVGWSHGGTVAIELARRHPHRVRSLTLLEPALFGVLSRLELLEALLPASMAWIGGRRAEAADQLVTVLWGPDWWSRLDRVLPGVAAAVARDLDALFGSDLPVHQGGWLPEPGAAGGIGGRILYVGGSASGPILDQVRNVVLDRLPGTTFVLLEGADQLFTAVEAPMVASALIPFLRTVSPVPQPMEI